MYRRARKDVPVFFLCESCVILYFRTQNLFGFFTRLIVPLTFGLR